MKLKYSFIPRRQFLNTLIGGFSAALFASFLNPIIKFIFPPYREPDRIILPFSNFKNMLPHSIEKFSWGNKPGILKKTEDGLWQAFVAVCTHLDCNVSYIPTQKKFFCACHEGWYDENGKNIKGPPPRPLRQLIVIVEGEDMIIKREGVD